MLHGVEEYHSLNLSAKHMGMAYSKAWRIVKLAEETLGIQLLYRMGKSGSRLTREGTTLLEVYEEAEKEASRVVCDIFENYYRENNREHSMTDAPGTLELVRPGTGN